MKKLLRAFILATIMSLSFSITALAGSGTVGNGTSGDSKQTSGLWFDGVSWTKSGFLIYVVSETNYDGEVSAIMEHNPVLVFVQEKPDNPNTLYYVNAKAGGGSFKSVYTGGAPWGMPPFNNDGSGNGGAIKDWLCAMQGSSSGAAVYSTFARRKQKSICIS